MIILNIPKDKCNKFIVSGICTYIAIAMYQITLTSEEEKSYPSCYVKHGYPTTLSIHMWQITLI